MAIVDSVIQSLRNSDKDFELTDKGSINTYLGILIEDIDENCFKMSQPILIQRIIQFLALDPHKTKGRNTPVGKPLLNRDLDRIQQKHTWLYRGAVGMLSYLCNRVRPDI